jgi:putative SOS response-associated peptidase YedK
VCGRYGASWGVDDLVAEFEIDSVDLPDGDRLTADWNVAPTKPVYAVLTRRQKEGPAEEPATRRLVVLRWGLVPFWAKDPKVGARMINARVESVAQKPAFREAFARRRCLLPADGYYEWTATENPAGRPVKQPFFIHAHDGGTLAMAGLYEFWRDPARDRDDPSAWLRTCTILTTTATDSIGHIHDRQPLFVEPRSWSDWLDPERQEVAGLADLLVAAPVGGLTAYPVSTAVNDHRNNGPELALPVDEAAAYQLF